MKAFGIQGMGFPLIGLLALVSLTSRTCAAPGDLYAADWDSDTIFKFAPDGTKSTFATALNGPGALAFDNKGNLYVLNSRDGIIFKFAPDGVKSTFVSGQINASGLAFDGAGNLFETTSDGGDPPMGTVLKFAPDGTQTTFASGLVAAWAPTFDQSGNVYVADDDANNGGTFIYKFAPDGTRSTFASGLYNSDSMAFDASGNLYSRDESGVIFKFTPDGTRTTFFVSESSTIVSLAFDSSGNLFAGLVNPDAIVRITPAGVQTVFASDAGSFFALAFEPITEKLLNISARGVTGTGDNVLIGGFIVGGNALNNNAVVVRAIGPSLSDAGVDNPLQDPVVELHDSNGAIIASNDDWQDTQEAQIRGTGLAPTNTHESAIFATLPAGSYTAVVRGVVDTTGVALVEVYNVHL